MATGSAILDVTDADFAASVIERSRTTPVVVDFWAPWCGPCKMLGPVLERVASDHAGDVILAKLNTDENPRTAMQFGIQGIPAVKAFRDGAVVSEFVGAVPEPQVRAFFAQLAPSVAQRTAQEAEELASRGDTESAERRFRDALEADASDVSAIVGLARILLDRDERDEADELLKRAPTDRRAKGLRHRIFLEGFAQRHANEDIEGEARANPSDPRARYRLGVMLAAQERYAEALEELLESVALQRDFADGAARKAALAVFDILGPKSDLTRDYQRRLSALLF